MTYTIFGASEAAAERAALELFDTRPHATEPGSPDRRVSVGVRSFAVPAHATDETACEVADRLAEAHGVCVLWRGETIIRTAVAGPVARESVVPASAPNDPTLHVVGGAAPLQASHQAVGAGASTLEVIRARRAAAEGQR
jgi:hypothetical protein